MSTQKIALLIPIFLPSFSLSGWKPHVPLAVSSSTASALTPRYSVPPLTGCVMLGKSGDCSDTFLHWKAEMTSEAICMLFTSAFLIKSKTSSSITYMG